MPATRSSQTGLHMTSTCPGLQVHCGAQAAVGPSFALLLYWWPQEALKLLPLDQHLTSTCPGLQVHCGAQEAVGLAVCLPDLPARPAALLVAMAPQPVQGRHQGHRVQVGRTAQPATAHCVTCGCTCCPRWLWPLSLCTGSIKPHCNQGPPPGSKGAALHGGTPGTPPPGGSDIVTSIGMPQLLAGGLLDAPSPCRVAGVPSQPPC